MRTAHPRPIAFALAWVLALGSVAPGAAYAQASAFRHRPVERARSPLVGRADVSGVVFEDLDENGLFDPTDRGLAEVVVALDDGRYAVTDGRGRYQLNELRPGQRALVIRSASLPTGAAAAGGAVIREVPPGAWVRVDFPITFRRETLQVGRPEELGYRVFPSLEELPVNVVGNATDIQALANGVRVDFPSVDLDLRGVGRGGYVPADRLGRVSIRLRERAARNPTRWRVELVGADGRVLWTRAGEAKPPRRLPLPDTDSSGARFAVPAAYSVRMCVEYGPDVSACSPYRPFGVTQGGRGAVQLKLEAPAVETQARVNGAVAPLDPDGSFILPVTPGPDRRIAITLTRADGRHAQSAIDVPVVELVRPTAPFAVEWGSQTEEYTAPAEPGPLQVAVSGRTVPPTTRVQVAKAEVAVDDGAFATQVTAPLGRQRHEIVVTSPQGWNTVYELTLLLGQHTPEGEAIVTVPGVPSLSVALPPEGVPLTRGVLHLRGEAEDGATVVANGVTLTTGGGTFEGEVAVDPAEGRLEVTVTDPAGRSGTILRRWPVETAGTDGTLWADAEPFVRLPHGTDAGDLRRGFAGTLRATAHRWGWQGLSAFGNVSVSSLDRLSTDDEAPWLAPEVFAGAEGWLGESVVLGARYGGAFFVNPFGDELPMRHEGFLSAAWHGESWDVYSDVFAGSGATFVDEAAPLGGAGLGLQYRHSADLGLRAYVAGGLPLSADDEGQVLDASGQVTWHPAAPGWPVLTLRVAHLQDTRTRGGEAEGTIGHLGLVLPLHRRVQLVQAAGAWLGENGALTGLNVTRLVVSPTDRTRLALDYRLQTGPPDAHAFSAEGDWRALPWLRLGLVYRLTTASAGGETSSRVQARLQALF